MPNPVQPTQDDLLECAALQLTNGDDEKAAEFLTHAKKAGSVQPTQGTAKD